MEMILFRPKVYERLHNCSIIDIESVPLEQRQHPKAGIVLLVTAVILEVGVWSLSNFANSENLQNQLVAKICDFNLHLLASSNL